ncbi:MAG: hypothetical protein K0S46_624 [Moraxellaceae bacterium]|jgi:hypothetical protein|nr:hypothetical protein [Moraxellaceae bacterium]
MSFAAQEQALLDLLFDRERRAAFRQDAVAALAPYELEESERADFATIRIDALELDAMLRTGLILAQFCRSYPLSFSLVSSLPGGLDLLRRFVDAALMRTPPPERVSAFGIRLRDALQQASGVDSPRERTLLLGIAEAELGMAWTAQQARAAALAGTLPAADTAVLPADWLQRPLRLAPFTSAAILPRPYQDLKDALCPCTGAELWRRLGREPLTPAARRQVLAQADLRLLMMRAVISRPASCEPVAEHVTLELGEGFARLLPHIDGRASVTALLASLRAAGAEDALLAGVTSGFRQLLQQGMLVAG